MHFKLYRNNPRSSRHYKGFGAHRLPVNQFLIWCGPIFIRVWK